MDDQSNQRVIQHSPHLYCCWAPQAPKTYNNRLTLQQPVFVSYVAQVIKCCKLMKETVCNIA